MIDTILLKGLQALSPSLYRDTRIKEVGMTGDLYPLYKRSGPPHET